MMSKLDQHYTYFYFCILLRKKDNSNNSFNEKTLQEIFGLGDFLILTYHFFVVTTFEV